jgi:hypothetical protein
MYKIELKRMTKATCEKTDTQIGVPQTVKLDNLVKSLRIDEYLYASTAKSRTWRAIFLMLERDGPGIL